ncbi:hypothetical protein T492DRAFT_887923 [Pavlovales sp. CCMP2436]|nr:hypothetical protein T492DRAFT_887923 [Pavlovales sp. CCMP2436]
MTKVHQCDEPGCEYKTPIGYNFVRHKRGHDVQIARIAVRAACCQSQSVSCATATSAPGVSLWTRGPRLAGETFIALAA